MTPAHHSATAHCDGGKKVMKLHLARQDCLMKHIHSLLNQEKSYSFLIQTHYLICLFINSYI